MINFPHEDCLDGLPVETLKELLNGSSPITGWPPELTKRS